MSNIKDFDKYLKFHDNEIIYNHKNEQLKVFIPTFYSDRNLFIIDSENETINYLGIIKIEIGNDTGIIIFPGMLSSIPSEILKNDKYIILIFNFGDIFVRNKYIIKTSIDIYNLFMTFAVLGKKIPFLKYEYLPFIFDNIMKVRGINLNSRRSCFELLYSELARDTKDLNKKYRQTNMKGDYQLISMRNIVYGPKDVTSKLLGSYFNDGLVSTLLVEKEHDNQRAKTIETLLKS